MIISINNMKKHLGIKNIHPKIVVQRMPYLVMKKLGRFVEVLGISYFLL